MQPVLDAEIARHPSSRPHLRGVDLAPVLAAAATLLAERAADARRELRAALGERFPDARRGRAGLRLPVPAAARAGAAPRRVGR